MKALSKQFEHLEGPSFREAAFLLQLTKVCLVITHFIRLLVGQENQILRGSPTTTKRRQGDFPILPKFQESSRLIQMTLLNFDDQMRTKFIDGLFRASQDLQFVALDINFDESHILKVMRIKRIQLGRQFKKVFRARQIVSIKTAPTSECDSF